MTVYDNDTISLTDLLNLTCLTYRPHRVPSLLILHMSVILLSVLTLDVLPTVRWFPDLRVLPHPTYLTYISCLTYLTYLSSLTFLTLLHLTHLSNLVYPTNIAHMTYWVYIAHHTFLS